MNLEIDEREILSKKQTDELLAEIRYQLAAAIVSQVMKRLGPAIELALKDIDQTLTREE